MNEEPDERRESQVDAVAVVVTVKGTCKSSLATRGDTSAEYGEGEETMLVDGGLLPLGETERS